MDEFRWIQMFVCLMLMIQIPVSVTVTSIFMKVGDDVTLPCLNVVNEKNNCDGTTWTFASRNKQTAELITLGQIGENPKTKSDRLSATANCSLLIKKLTIEEVGQYSCDHHKLREIQTQHTLFHQSTVDLSAITLTEHKETDKVKLSCSVVTHGECHHTVKWLIGGRDVDKESKQTVTSQTDCSTTLSFLIYHHIYNSRYNTVKCEVTDTKTGKVQLFTLSHQPSGEETGDNETTQKPTRTTESSTKSQTTTTMMKDASQDFSASLRFIIVSVGLAALLITTVTINIWTRTTGNKTQTNKTTGLSLNPAGTQSAPQTVPDLVRSHDGVDVVTCSTVKAPSSSVTATPDPSSVLYCTFSCHIAD
ncbi:uncharacterized protein LOC120432983 isoform X1 [Oreochromis aureus]|uniref:uncharacterized protein LOC120432983 isoform X1 n=1 Tax=Oreochromis aureus TaxID=47969 RepID=UPI0019539CE4|nr:uncharacterized protein LOC120432983 isoform X1 [Oreochromis aureus]